MLVDGHHGLKSRTRAPQCLKVGDMISFANQVFDNSNAHQTGLHRQPTLDYLRHSIPLDLGGVWVKKVSLDSEQIERVTPTLTLP